MSKINFKQIENGGSLKKLVSFLPEIEKLIAIEIERKKSMSILNDILDLMNDFNEKENKQPKKIFLTREKENQLILLPNIDIKEGPRKTFENGICGMKIVWDADEFKVE